MAMTPVTRISAPLAAAALALGSAFIPAAPAAAEPLDGAAPPEASAAVEQEELPTLTYEDVATWAEVLVDGTDVERDGEGLPFNTFVGFGSVSCNNTSNLLLDYKEENPEAYWRIMNLLFNQETGAGLAHIKVEMGSDTNSSSGAEPATKRSADEPADVLRGAGFHFIADALSINPDIKTEALRWGEPSWTGNSWDLRYQWYKETIDAAYTTYGVTFDYLSPAQNEIGGGSTTVSSYTDEVAWTVDFAKRLNADALKPDALYDYSQIKIVALDSYRAGDAVARAILANPEAPALIDAFGYHYDIAGSANITRLNKEFGMEILYSEGVSPMIEPTYRLEGEPARGGIGGTVGAVDIADRFINAYRWSGSEPNPAHMTGFLFQPAVSAMYEGTQYLPKSLIQASDPWSGFYEGGVGIVLVRHFMQFIDEGWEYVEGASYGNGTKGDGGTNVDTSTRTHLTLRTPQAAVADGADLELTQVHANNTSTVRNFEVKVANSETDGETPLYVWETRGPDSGEAVDANYFQNIGQVLPVRTESVGGVEHHVYQVQVQPYSVLTLTTDRDGVHDSATPYEVGEYEPTAENTVLPLPYTDDFEYEGYATTEINGTELGYVERRSGTPRYTADQNGAFEVVDSGDAERGNVLEQKSNAVTRGFTWDVWGSKSQSVRMTAPPATVLGDHSWTNYSASVDFRLDPVVRDTSLANFAGLGVRQVVAAGSDLATYSARVYSDGRWELRKLDAVVSSGSAFMFDPDAWHTLEVEARENIITATLDGEALGSYTDTTGRAVMAGRISVVSGIYNTRYDNLAITPIDGLSWSAEKIDDADPRISYPQGASYAQSGYAHLNRTLHSLTAGRSVTFDMEGTGFNLNGASAAATLDVVVDDAPPQRVSVVSTGNRQTSYWHRGLSGGQHSVTVTVVSGTYTLDGVDVLTGGDVPGEVDPSEKPVAVVTVLPRLATIAGGVPALPETVRATAEAGGEIDADVTWALPTAGFNTPYAFVRVEGTFDKNPSLKTSAYVEVVPRGLHYLIDANAPAGSPAYPAYAGLAQDSLRNAQPDGVYSAATGWGREGTVTGKGLLNVTPYDKTYETGWYSSAAATPITYRFTLPAGEYEIASGHAEWWNTGNTSKSRRVTATVQFPNGAGGTTTVALGSHTFPEGSRGASAVLGGTFTLPAESQVTYRVVGTGGTESPVLSWIGVHEAGTVDRTELAELLTRAQQAPRQAYTATTWNAVRSAAVAGNTVQQNIGASQAQVDAASAALRTALDALEEVAYLPLADYRVAVEVDGEVDLPDTVALRTISGAEQQVAVTWSGTPATGTAYRSVTVAGTANGIPVNLVVEVVPERLEYFIDAAGTQGGTSPAFDAVAALRGEELRNAAADAPFSGDAGWGLLNPIGSGSGYVGVRARAAGTYDVTRTTGWWASAGGSVNYELWLPAGEYEISSGYAEWWGSTRQVLPSVTTGGQTVTGDPVSLSGSVTAVSTIAFTHAQDGPVQFRAARGTGSADPVLSWVAVAAVGDETPVEEPLDVRTTVTPRCLAGKAYLYVSVTNHEEAAVAVTVTTPLGDKTFPALAPGKSASLALNSRAASIAGGAVGVSATSDAGTFDGTTEYAGITCG